jgi:hypothetical protein
MTDRAALVKRVSEVMALWLDCDPEPLEEASTAAIDLIRAEVLEEAAELVEQHTPRYGECDFRGYLIRRMAYDSIGLPYAAAIRALKGDT